MLHLLLGIFGCLCVFVLAQALTQAAVGKAPFQEGRFLYIFFGSTSLHGAILIGTAVFFATHDVGWAEAFGFRESAPWKVIGLGLLAAAAFVPVGEMLQWACIRLLEFFHHAFSPQAAVDEFLKVKTLGSRLYMTFAAVILAPVAEEILFRGLVYRMMRQALSRRTAMLFSALLFAAIHGSLPIFIPLAVMGALLAWLYEVTGNLLTPMITHAAFNAINVVIILFGDQIVTHVRHLFHSP